MVPQPLLMASLITKAWPSPNCNTKTDKNSTMRGILSLNSETKRISALTKSRSKSTKLGNSFELCTSKSALRLIFTRKICWTRSDTEANWKSELSILTTSISNWFQRGFRMKGDRKKKKHSNGKGSWKKESNKDDKSFKKENKEGEESSKKERRG